MADHSTHTAHIQHIHVHIQHIYSTYTYIYTHTWHTHIHGTYTYIYTHNITFNMLCASQIIFGKIYPLEMLFLSFWFVCLLMYHRSNLPQFFLEAAPVITTYVVLRKLQQRAVMRLHVIQCAPLMSIHLRVGGLTSQHSGRQTRDISLKHNFVRKDRSRAALARSKWKKSHL